MINVNQITSQLAKMPDQALQKYAALNKSDPYILALAVAESNRRKEMRQAAQGAQGMIPQPKVADQAVQGMSPAPVASTQPMPEDMGIGRLPAGDMNFADGGIVAFADGGDVERYQYGGMPPLSAGTEYEVPGMATGSMYQQAMAKAQQGKPLSDVEKALLASATPLAAVADTAMLPITALRKFVRSPLDKSPEPSWFPLTGEATSRLAKELPPEASYSNEGRREPMTAMAATPIADETKAKAKADEKLTPRPPTTAVASSTGGIEDIFKRLQKPIETDITALRDQRKTFAQSLQDFAKKEEADFEAAEAKRGDPFKAREERIAQREGELAGRKDQNLGLALLQAGAAIMSTPGSLGMALGKGVDVGTKQYASGIDKLNAAQERLLDARDRLEELRTNREDMTAKERRALKSNINRSVLEGEKLFLDGAEKDLGYRREDMKTLFSGLVTDMASQRSAAATAAAANRTPAEIQLIERIAKERGISFAQAYQDVATMKREPASRDAALKNWTTNQAAIQALNPNIKTFEDYYATLGGGGGGLDGFRVVGVR